MSNEGIKKVFVTKLTDVADTDLEGIGVLRFEGAKIYKWVTYNTGTGVVAAVAGNAVVYHGDDAVTVDSAADVTSDTADGTIGAGVLQSAPTIGQYCWIQIKGVAILTTALTAGADGNSLTAVGAGDGTFTTTGVLATDVPDFVCAVALDASAKIVLLDCPW